MVNAASFTSLCRRADRKEGVGVTGGLRLSICDIECKVRWYIDINLGLAIFKKSEKSLNS